MRLRKITCAACASIAYGICASGLMSLAAAAQDASKPIRFLVPFAAAARCDANDTAPTFSSLGSRSLINLDVSSLKAGIQCAAWPLLPMLAA